MITEQSSYIERKLPQTKLAALDPWELEWLLNHLENDLLCLEDQWIAEHSGVGEIAEKLGTLWDKLIRAKGR